MQTVRQTACLMALGCLALSTPAVAVAETAFLDLPPHHWATRYIEALTQRGIVSGYPNHTFQPGRSVSRAEFAVILAKSQGVTLENSPNQPIARFQDVPNTHWAASAIAAVVSQGWMRGYPNHRFKPSQSLTLAEMYVILSKAESGQHTASLEPATIQQMLSPYRDRQEVPTWAKASVAQALQSGITVSELSQSRLMPNLPAVRATVATSVAKLINPALRTQAIQSQPAQVPQTAAATVEQSALLQYPAANLVGVLEADTQPHQWVLVRADGKRFHFSAPANQSPPLQAGQQVRLSGNIDAINGTAAEPVITAEQIIPLEPLAPKQPTNVEAIVAPAVVEEQPPVEAAPRIDTPVGTKEESPTPTQAEVPVPQADPAPERVFAGEEIQLYFPNFANLVSDSALMLGEPVSRPVKGLDTPRKALEAVLQGPTEAERLQGFYTDEGTLKLHIDKLSVSPEGKATVLLQAPGDFAFSNSGAPARLSEQIRRTLKQFKTIQTVSVSVKDAKHKVIWISP